MSLYRVLFIVLVICTFCVCGILQSICLTRHAELLSRSAARDGLESVTQRLRSELKMMTVSNGELPRSPSAGEGYFVYYDGPISDASGILHGEQPGVSNLGSFQDSKYGDFDDYIAFTAEAPEGAWFTGRVPRYIVERRPLPTNLTINDLMAPVVIRSKYAEIIYWIAPETVRDPDGTVNLFAATEMPLYRDGNEDRIPDQLVLHRRVLLIRPDLNLDGRLPTLDIPNASGGGTVRIGDLPTFNGVLSQSFIGTNPSVDAVQAMFASHWLTGLTLAHQFFDLSLRRVSETEGTGSLIVDVTRNVGGVAKPSILSCNSLADLTAPENRFAHVRVPGQYFGFDRDTATSMPLLALGFDNDLLDPANGARANAGVPGISVVASGGTVTHPLFNGFLLPQFELSAVAASLTGMPQWDRGGEDVLARNLLAFDVKAYDPTAPTFLTVGEDGQPGTGGTNDDGIGGVDDSLQEYGARFSDDTIITVNDPGVYAIMESAAIHPSLRRTLPSPIPSGFYQQPAVISTGSYVDLGYSFQGGGALRDMYIRAQGENGIRTRASNFFQSTYAGLNIPATGTMSSQYYLNATEALTKSGKATGFFFQPVYDTWSDHYESDGFDQGQMAINSGGTIQPIRGTFWLVNFQPTGTTEFFPKLAVRGGLDGTTYHPSATGTSAAERRARVDEATNHVDEVSPANVSSLHTVGIDDATERETSPPFPAPLTGLRIQLRLEDSASREIIDSTVIHDVN